MSEFSDVYEKDLSKYAGQEIEFVITEFNPKRRRVIGDRKQLAGNFLVICVCHRNTSMDVVDISDFIVLRTISYLYYI